MPKPIRGASFFINLTTLTAEIGCVALALQLATDVELGRTAASGYRYFAIALFGAVR